MQKIRLGHLGENLALAHLRNNGYKIIARNFRSKYGEIDLVATEKDTLVFVEVKIRFSKKFGSPEESITPWKIKRIIKTGQYFKLLHPEYPDSLRLDAVVVDLSSEEKLERVEIIKNITQ